MKRLIAASLALVFLLAAGGLSSATGPLRRAATNAAGGRHVASGPCPRLYTIAMAKRAIRAVYAGTRDTTLGERGMLNKMVRCQHSPGALRYVLSYRRHAYEQWWARRHPPFPYRSVASVYDDSGQLACPWSKPSDGLAVAHKTLPCGTRVTFSYGGRQATATVDDRGPYVGGREWDLNMNVMGALGFPYGVAAVDWRYGE